MAISVYTWCSRPPATSPGPPNHHYYLGQYVDIPMKEILLDFGYFPFLGIFEIWRIFYSWPIDRRIYHAKDGNLFFYSFLFYFILNNYCGSYFTYSFVRWQSSIHHHFLLWMLVESKWKKMNEWMNGWMNDYGSHRTQTLGMIMFCAAIWSGS